MFKTVLFPIDQSRESREAVDTVVNLVKTYRSRLVLLSVVESPEEGQVAPVAGEMASPEAITPSGNCEATAQLLTEFKSVFQQQGIDAEAIEREGIPAFVICDVADEVEANLIVMGCRGLGLTEEGASESVTNRVINLAPCAVLVVP